MLFLVNWLYSNCGFTKTQLDMSALVKNKNWKKKTFVKYFHRRLLTLKLVSSRNVYSIKKKKRLARMTFSQMHAQWTCLNSVSEVHVFLYGAVRGPCDWLATFLPSRAWAWALCVCSEQLQSASTLYWARWQSSEVFFFFFFYTGLFEGLVDFAAKFKAIYIYTPVVILVSLFEVAINACLDSTGRFGKPASAADN